MTEESKDDDAPVDREWSKDDLRRIWQEAGGTFYSSNRGETGAMQEHKLLPFLGKLLRGIAPTPAPAPAPALKADVDAEQTKRPPTESEVEGVLGALIDAIVPGLSTGDLLKDAAAAANAMEVTAPAGFFQIEQGHFLHVDARMQHNADVFPLFRRARTVDEAKATPAKKKGGK